MAARPHPTALLLLVALGYISTVWASITCALPAGGAYKAGDPITLDWGSDGTSPVVTDIKSINGTLFCNAGKKIADVSIPNLTGPFTWSVPSVGNATTVGGTTGECAQNAFHMEYSGEAAGFLDIVNIPWGPVRCGTITISPAPNGTLTTTTIAMTSTATSTPTATYPVYDSDKGGISTTVVVIIAVVAAILATLSVVALVVFFRRQKRQRKLDKALMPWNTSNMNQFSQVSTVDEGSGSPRHSGSGPGASIGMSSVAGAGAAAAAAHALKPQPTLPQPSRGTYYSDDSEYNNYGYHHQQQQQQQQLLQQQGYNHQQDYDGGYTDVDSYYNPYYASSAIGSATGPVMGQSNPSFYGAPFQSTSGLYLHQQQQQQQQEQYQQHEQLGYVPPPPRSGASNTSPVASSTSKPRSPAGTADDTISAPLGSALTSLPTSSSATSSPKRAPQTVMQEMGRREAEAPLKNVPTPNTTV
ncbi:hypothetical protein BGZ75_010263 [Mortierella antarctica]|nr:hypothetical protein BGZ75_010263 [Mortierella antarctica]